MSVVRRAAAATVVAGLVLLGGPAWAQEDPCAPDDAGNVPEMCQGGLAPEPGAGAEDACPAQPVEPGDGQVVDEGDAGDQGVAEGEPAPDQEPRPEPDPDEQTVVGPSPGTSDDDGVMCAFGAPVSAPVTDSAPVLESAPVDTARGDAATAAGSLPRTGSYDRFLALGAVGAGFLVIGAGAVAAGRRRAQEQ